MLTFPTTEDNFSDLSTMSAKSRIAGVKLHASSSPPPSKYYKLEDEYSDSSGGSGYYNDYPTNPVSTIVEKLANVERLVNGSIL